MASDIAFAVHRALLGEVSSALRGVTVGVSDRVLTMRLYYDGPISRSDQESVSEIETSLLADLHPRYEVKVTAARVDVPAPIECLDSWAFRRRED